MSSTPDSTPASAAGSANEPTPGAGATAAARCPDCGAPGVRDRCHHLPSKAATFGHGAPPTSPPPPKRPLTGLSRSPGSAVHAEFCECDSCLTPDALDWLERKGIRT